MSAFKKIYAKIIYSSLFIALGSLVWFVVRTGMKPSRAVYPCQQAARGNIFLFGLPLVLPVVNRLRSYPIYFFGLLLGLSFALGLNFTRLKNQLVANVSMKGQVLAGVAGSRVVWAHNINATNWTGGYYWDSVNQTVVNTMTDNGLMALTGTQTIAAAWKKLIPNYQVGQKIAIKVNFNNSSWCDNPFNNIDALMQPVNSLVKGLLLAYPTLNTSDIGVYDATYGPNPASDARQIPCYFINKSLYSGINFYDSRKGGDCGCNKNTLKADYTNTSANVVFSPPGGIPQPPTTKLTDVLVNATYVINMPIMKKHIGGGVTLGFKNHLGSIANAEPFHDYIFDWGAHYSISWNPLVDIYRNSNIANKTILTVGDGLFGRRSTNIGTPDHWDTFGGRFPNSLFFSTDPVAIDSVMLDLLDQEWGMETWAADYLKYAASKGLGVFENGQTLMSEGQYSGAKYATIDLVYCKNSVCPTSPPLPIPGDINSDLRVDIIDLRQLLSSFTQIFDYNLVVGNFGRTQ